MGVENPIPPFTMDAATPDGAPPRRINYTIKKTTICPAVPYRGPEAGSPPNIQYLQDFYSSGMNRIGSCPVLQSRFFSSIPGRCIQGYYPAIGRRDFTRGVTSKKPDPAF
jgi:hypothetical protein